MSRTSPKLTIHTPYSSIPGFGWSGAPKKAANTQGGLPWDFTKSAICFNAVMLSLGYEKYVTQGGDWGSMLTRHAAQCFPDNIKAIRRCVRPSIWVSFNGTLRRRQFLLRCHNARRNRGSDRPRKARSEATTGLQVRS